jgi:hypothetical protein
LGFQHPFDALRNYLPAGSFELIMPYILNNKVHLVITRERQTKLGDFRHAYQGNNHRITVNGNLNRFAFLITLIHEIAHLEAYRQFGPRIAPHGREWKTVYGQLLQQFVAASIFPADIAHELKLMMRNPAASSGAEDDLQRVLRNYDRRKTGLKTIEELPDGAKFKLQDGREFLRETKLRKRIRCLEVETRRVYLFHPLYEVQIAS